MRRQIFYGEQSAPGRYKIFVLCIVGLCLSYSSFGQRYLTDYDSSFFIRDTVLPLVKRYGNLHFSGYIQPQFQWAQEKGIASFSGGNFQKLANNRFMLRRARVKIDYKMAGKNSDFPAALFTFQFEATERDVNVRDVFVRIYEPSMHNFSMTAGLFARPFGYEVNLSSSFRETPERGRMSQILMPSERDLGAMVSYEAQSKVKVARLFKWDAGLFNGQGKSGPAEFDSYKDLISRITLKPLELSKTYTLSGGLSLLLGGMAQSNKMRYTISERQGNKFFEVDSSESNIGGKAPRHYYGADVQLSRKHNWGKTEVRAEYWRGIQPGTGTTTSNPGTLPEDPTYIRNFDGAFFYFLQNIVNERWELMAKYDWYDPNRDVTGNELGKPGTNFTPADVKFATTGIGLTHYFTDKLKALVYYDIVRNEKTSLASYRQDVKDNVLTLRIQMRF